MDFIEALPKVNGKSVIMTVVDRFSKAAHFIALAHPYTAVSVARAFFAEVVRLHGIPATIVSDRDPVFTSSFWRGVSCFIWPVSNFSLHQHSILSQTASRKQQTKSSTCTCGASQEIAHAIG